MRYKRCSFCFLLIVFFLVNLAPVYAANRDSVEIKAEYPKTLGKSALLMDASTGRVLFESGAHQRMAPASVTKIMTALLVAENGELDRKVTISGHAADTPESSIWLEAGEKLTREQLLYACMLNSANDAAMALAESVAGSEEKFVEMMNRRAQELGMRDTHFCNPHGLENTLHYTSAYDLALLSREAMKHSVFRQVVSTKTKNIPWTGKDYDRLLINQNRLLYRYETALGIKTGYTKQAGNCVVGAAQKGSLLLIAVALNSPSVYEDLEQMLDYGFDHYNKITVKKSNQLSVEVPVINGQAKTVRVSPKTDLTVTVRADEQSSLDYKLYPPEQVAAPVKKGQLMGYCVIYVAGQEAGRVDLLAEGPVAAKPSWLERVKATGGVVLKISGAALLIIFCALYSIRIVNLRRRRKKRVYRI